MDAETFRKAQMKLRQRISASWFLSLLLLTLPALVEAQFTFTTNADNTITITAYTGSGGDVTIPSTTNGLPVTSIGYEAFERSGSITNVTIPSGVTNIGEFAFAECSSLLTITVDTLNGVFSSAFGVLFNRSQTMLIQCPSGKGGGYTIPNSVTSIGAGSFLRCLSLTNVTIPSSITNIDDYAFNQCFSLTSITIPNSVTTIGDGAFANCLSLTNISIPNSVTNIGDDEFDYCSSLSSVTIPNSITSIGSLEFTVCGSLTNVIIPNSVGGIGYEAFSYCPSLVNITIPSSVTNIQGLAFEVCPRLTSVFFMGDAPAIDPSAFADDNATVYYLPGSTGWGTTIGGCPTALWNPQLQAMGVQSNGFAFTITGTTNIPLVVEACTNLANASWTPLQTCTLTNGLFFFSDPQWTNYPARFYRLRSP